MKCKLVKLDRLSGKKATFYVVEEGETGESLFGEFLKSYRNIFKSEIESILLKMETMGHRTGAREEFFKTFEGELGDGVCALYDSPGSHLRLYCIRYGTEVVILGGGGHKPKSIRSLQESAKLKAENYKMRQLSALIRERMGEKEIRFSPDYRHLVGNLMIETDEED